MHRVGINLFGLGPRGLNLTESIRYLQYSKAKDDVAMDNYQKYFEDLTKWGVGDCESLFTSTSVLFYACM